MHVGKAWEEGRLAGGGRLLIPIFVLARSLLLRRPSKKNILLSPVIGDNVRRHGGLE